MQTRLLVGSDDAHESPLLVTKPIGDPVDVIAYIRRLHAEASDPSSSCPWDLIMLLTDLCSVVGVSQIDCDDLIVKMSGAGAIEACTAVIEWKDFFSWPVVSLMWSLPCSRRPSFMLNQPRRGGGRKLTASSFGSWTTQEEIWMPENASAAPRPACSKVYGIGVGSTRPNQAHNARAAWQTIQRGCSTSFAYTSRCTRSTSLESV